ncbi:hypothetical protein BB561_000343 [Smittium simulii]|uniref:Ribosome biogenesis regulatory protein n=1 Tax=Smittium simulii TaxID=133385 RepID=A0A2T9YZH5_9FUNG|nr:hypothetical protein BB561_000343 [Smittium simulii]
MSVDEIIKKQQAESKDIFVSKIYPVALDLGLLAAFDENLLGIQPSKSADLESELLKNTRDATQLLINKIVSLPVENTDEGIMAKLPQPENVIPREKPVPKEKPLTRWEKFAKIKGINKKKKDRMVYDEQSGKVRPAWGYKGINKKEEEQWLIPLPDNPNQDPDIRKTMAEKRNASVAKNSRRQKRNLEEAAQSSKKNTKPGLDARATYKKKLKQSIVFSKTATASLGKFDKKVEGEPKTRKPKRKLESVTRSAKDERDINKAILSKLF